MLHPKSYTPYHAARHGMRRRHYFASMCVLILSSLACSLPGGGNNAPTPAVPPAGPTTAPTAAVPEVVTQPAATLPSPTQAPTSLLVPTQAAAATETSAPVPAPATGYLGDVAEQGGYFLSAAAVADPYTPDPNYPLGPGNKIVAVEITVGNQSGGVVTVNPFYTVLVDEAGATYLAVPAVLEDRFILVDLRPRQRVRGWVTFETPEAAVPSAVRYELVGISEVPLEVSLAPAPAGHTPVMPTAPAAPQPALPRLRETVQQDGFSLSAVTVEDPAAASGLYTLRPGRRLVAVEIVVGNSTGEVVQVNPLDALLVDSEGYLYDEQLSGRQGGELPPGSLNPGETVQGWVAFSIPENAEPASIIYLISAPSGRIYMETGIRP